MIDLREEDHAVLSNSILFCGLSEQGLRRHLQYYQGSVRSYGKGTFLVGTEETMKQFGLVLDGTVQAVMDDINGDRIIMANVAKGITFGEALCFTRRLTEMYIIASTDCRVLWLSCDNLWEHPQQLPDAQLRFTRLLANRTLQMNDRIQVLSKKSLRAKLITFFSQCVGQNKEEEFVLDMDRETMAAYLGIDRSALSRELSRMRAEGLLVFRKNHFRLLRFDHDKGPQKETAGEK